MYFEHVQNPDPPDNHTTETDYVMVSGGKDDGGLAARRTGHVQREASRSSILILEVHQVRRQRGSEDTSKSIDTD